jgi:Tol biopolymer transport system component
MVGTRRRRSGRRIVGALGVTAIILLAGCAQPPRPPGGPGSTTTTSAPASTTTMVTSPTTTTATPSTTTTLSPPTTTTSTTVPAEPVGTIERVSDSMGGEGGGSSYGPTISGDGSRVAYWSTAWDLTPGDSNGTVPDVYLWDAPSDTTALLYQSPFGGNTAPVVSDDGRVVAYTSNGSSVVVWDTSTGTASRVGSGRAQDISADGSRVLFTSGVGELFVWDATAGTTTLVTDRGDGSSMSGDGRYVAYSAGAAGSSDDTGVANVFVWDATTGDTIRITDGDDASGYPDISADGRFVAFGSSASNLIPGEASAPGVFVWDAATGVTRRAADGGLPSISADGRYVALSLSNHVPQPNDTNGLEDVYLWDATTGTTTRLTEGDGNSYAPSISADGSAVTFSSEAANLTTDDPDGVQDVFVWRRSN